MVVAISFFLKTKKKMGWGNSNAHPKLNLGGANPTTRHLWELSLQLPQVDAGIEFSLPQHEYYIFILFFSHSFQLQNGSQMQFRFGEAIPRMEGWGLDLHYFAVVYPIPFSKWVATTRIATSLRWRRRRNACIVEDHCNHKPCKRSWTFSSIKFNW